MTVTYVILGPNASLDQLLVDTWAKNLSGLTTYSGHMPLFID